MKWRKFAVWLVPLALIAGVVVFVLYRLGQMTEPFRFLDGHRPVRREATLNVAIPGTSYIGRTYFIDADYADFVRRVHAELEPQGWMRRSQNDLHAVWVKQTPHPAAPPSGPSTTFKIMLMSTVVVSRAGTAQSRHPISGSRKLSVVISLHEPLEDEKTIWQKLAVAFGL